MTTRAKPYSLYGEPTAEVVERIDEMFDVLFHDLASNTHALLSASHDDTVAATPVRASMIIADSDDLWAMVTPTVAGTFPRYDGADTTFSAVSETDITDGTIFARVADAETITGRWYFTTGRIVIANGTQIRGRNSGDTADINLFGWSSTTITIGSGSSTVTQVDIKGDTSVNLYAANIALISLTTASLSSQVPFYGNSGSASAPNYSEASFTTTGMWIATGPIVGFTTGGTERGRFNSSGLLLANLTSGSVVFAGGSGLLTQDNSAFFWDNSNKRLLLKTSAVAGTGGFQLLGTSVTTGLTTIAATDVAGFIRPTDPSDGGVTWTAMSSASTNPFLIRAIFGSTDPTDTTAAIAFRGGRRSGTDGSNLADDETPFQFQKYDGTQLVTILGDGRTGFGTATPATTIQAVGVIWGASGTSAPAGGSTAARLNLGATSGFGIYYGSGAPTVSAPQGSLYLRTDGSSTSTRAYINTDGGTTWTNIVTAA